MKSLRKISAGLFGFDRRERRGTYVLSAMLVVLLAVRFTAFRPGSVPDELSPLPLPDPAQGLQAIAGAVQSGPALFTFDPNTVSYDDMLLLGLTERQAATLVNYRGAGARFKRPEEIARVYGLDSATVARLTPYIVIKDRDVEGAPGGMKARVAATRGYEETSGGVKGRVAATRSNEGAPGGVKARVAATHGAEEGSRGAQWSASGETDSRRAPRSATGETETRRAPWSASGEAEARRAPWPSSGEAESTAPLIDLNLSSAAALERLPGIGPVLAARIIKYRNLLGGFVDCRQLTEVYGLDSSVVSLILPMVTVNLDSVSPLLLDSASFGDLARHPYVGYEAARLISRYRTLTETPLTLGSMVSGNVITAAQAERLAPYVRPSPGAAGTDYEFISSKVLK